MKGRKSPQRKPVSTKTRRAVFESDASPSMGIMIFRKKHRESKKEKPPTSIGQL
jgi:hypothetical protein